MARPTFLVDCDGVLCDFVSAFLDLVRIYAGKQFAPHDVTAFDFRDALGLTPDEFRLVKSHIDTSNIFCGELQVHEGAQDAIAELEAIGDVYVVTSPWNSCPTWVSQREAWLKEHFDIPHSRVIHTSAKHLVRGDMLIDDRASTVEEYAKAWPKASAMLWDAPYNRDSTHRLRAGDWSTVISEARCL